MDGTESKSGEHIVKKGVLERYSGTQVRPILAQSRVLTHVLFIVAIVDWFNWCRQIKQRGNVNTVVIRANLIVVT